MKAERWRAYAIAADATHHLLQGRPAYSARFDNVLKFHAPGLAPVTDASGAYHITPDGAPAYAARHLRTFGYYEGRAAAQSHQGWLHILPTGAPLGAESYAWCGNYQEGLCAVRTHDGAYLHIDLRGAPAYEQRYRYVGDFRDGFAVAQREDGKHSHIDPRGRVVHGVWFEDLDVFHKGHARARDADGWHHVNLRGEPLYRRRFRAVEPFYNGQARVEDEGGGLLIVNPRGETVLTLRAPRRSPVDALSADMVGFWRTQTIRAAVALGVFEMLPATAEAVEAQAKLAPSMGARLLRALVELDLTRLADDGRHHATERGLLLTKHHPFSLANAAAMWGDEHYAAWTRLAECLRTGVSGFQALYQGNIFDWLADQPAKAEIYQAAFDAYARHDYRALAERIDLGGRRTLLDAGGGRGALAFALLRAFPALRAAVMDRPEVVRGGTAPEDIAGRCRFVAGDLFARWPVRADAIVLARVLHDWPDAAALCILRRARAAVNEGGALYIVEMLLDDARGRGGLLDLNMLAATGGAERTEGQFRALLAAARFQPRRTTATGGVSSIIMASPA